MGHTKSIEQYMTALAGKFGEALGKSNYLDVVKVLENAGGALLLTGQFVPLGIVLLTPVLVNVLLFDVLLMGKPGLGQVFLVMLIFLIWAYRSHFLPLLAQHAKIGA